MIGLIIALGLIAALAVYGLGIYNGLVRLRDGIEAAWAEVDALLKERHDELPNLIEICKRYMQFEPQSLEKVMRARTAVAQASAARNVAAVGAAEQRLRAGVTRMVAAAEGYPHLRADLAFARLRDRIIALEASIADRRESYNGQVNLNNIRINVFPDAVIALQLGFRCAELLEFAEAERPGLGVGALSRA